MKTSPLHSFLMKFSLCLFLVLLGTSSSLNASPNSRKEKFVYDSQGKRNPFVPFIEQVEDSGDAPVPVGRTPEQTLSDLGVSVSAIFWGGKNPACLIGDDILEIGQIIKGVVVRNIEQNHVVFEVNGELVELMIHE